MLSCASTLIIDASQIRLSLALKKLLKKHTACLGQYGHVSCHKNLSQTKLLVVCFQVLHDSEGNNTDGMHFGSMGV